MKHCENKRDFEKYNQVIFCCKLEIMPLSSPVHSRPTLTLMRAKTS